MITFDLKPKEVEKKLEMSLDDLIKIGGKKSSAKAGKAPKTIVSKDKAGATGIAAKKQAIKGRRAAAGSTQAPKMIGKASKGGNAPKTLAKGGRVIKVGRGQVKGKVGSLMAKKILTKARANKQGQQGQSAPKVLPTASGRRKGGAAPTNAPKTIQGKRRGGQVVQRGQNQNQDQDQRQVRGNKGRGRGNINDGYKANQGGRGLGRVARGGVRKQRGMGMMGAYSYTPQTQALAAYGQYSHQGMHQQATFRQAPYSTTGAHGMQYTPEQLQIRHIQAMQKYQKDCESFMAQKARYEKAKDQLRRGGGGGRRGGKGGNGGRR